MIKNDDNDNNNNDNNKRENNSMAALKRLINNTSHQKTWTCLRKGKLKRETESLLIAAQNKCKGKWKEG